MCLVVKYLKLSIDEESYIGDLFHSLISRVHKAGYGTRRTDPNTYYSACKSPEDNSMYEYPVNTKLPRLKGDSSRSINQSTAFGGAKTIAHMFLKLVFEVYYTCAVQNY